MAPIMVHTFIPSNLFNTCQFCARGKGSPYHKPPQPAPFCSPEPLFHTFTPSSRPHLCLHCAREKGTPYHINLAPGDDRQWFPDHLSDTSNLSSEADGNDGDAPPVQLLAEFEETTRIIDDLREFADQAFKTHADPAFTHPLKYAMHLMKIGFTSLSTPPPPPPPLSSSSCSACALKDEMISYLDERLPIPRSFSCVATQTAPPPPPMPARVHMDAASQTSRPQRADCGAQATPVPSPTPPARVLADMGSQTPPPALPPPRPTRAPRRSQSPTPRSPSTCKDFEKVLARLTSLREEVSPPPSPPPTPHAASPMPPARTHFYLTIAVPHGLDSLTIDLVDRPPASIYTGSFMPAPPPPIARAHRGQSRGRPLASPVWGSHSF